MRFTHLALAAVISLGIGAGCNKNGNDSNSGNQIDIDAECDIELCAENPGFKAVCIDEYNDCVTAGGDEQECLVFATETCTV